MPHLCRLVLWRTLQPWRCDVRFNHGANQYHADVHICACIDAILVSWCHDTPNKKDRCLQATNARVWRIGSPFFAGVHLQDHWQRWRSSRLRSYRLHSWVNQRRQQCAPRQYARPCPCIVGPASIVHTPPCARGSSAGFIMFAAYIGLRLKEKCTLTKGKGRVCLGLFFLPVSKIWFSDTESAPWCHGVENEVMST